MDPGRQFEPEATPVDAVPVRAKRPIKGLHRQSVDEYHMAREAAQVHRETATGGYAAEMKAYGPIITYKSWLMGRKQDKPEGY